MRRAYPFTPGDWIIAEDEFAIVESIVPTYFEPYDPEMQEDTKVGAYKETIITYHTFCTLQGRVCSSKPQIKVLDFCNWIKPLSTADAALLEQIKSKKPKAWSTWMAKCKDATDSITIYVKVEKGTARKALTQFRKLTKSLPESFHFSALQPILSIIPVVKAETASTEESEGDQILFELCYRPKDQHGKSLSFYKIKGLDYTEDLTSFVNFEGVFLSMYQPVRLYSKDHESEELTQLAERLKAAFLALANADYEKDALAKDFFKKAPKLCYSPEEAYSTIQDFLSRHSEELGAEDFIERVKNRDQEILSMYCQQMAF